MHIFKINTKLKSEFRQQRKAVFGNKRYWFHIAIWVAVITLFTNQFASSPAANDVARGYKDGMAISINLNSKSKDKDANINITKSLVVANTAIGCAISAILVYVFLLVIIPLARYRKQKRILILGFIGNCLVWVISLFVAGFVVGYFGGATGKEAISYVGLAVGIVASVSAIIAGYFFSIYYFIDLYDQQKNLARFQQIFTEKLQAETTFLKTQINPHFLFNTLNNIYSLALNQSDDAPVITHQLKDLVKYMLEDCTHESVKLSGEIAFLKNYINLEKLRNKKEDVDINLQVNGDVTNNEIAPLLLINFIENAFKHGVKSGAEHAYVNIHINVMDGVLSMNVANSIPAKTTEQNLAVKEAGGIGIKNVNRRLEILYANKHKLKIVQTEKEYNVQLTIELL